MVIEAARLRAQRPRRAEAQAERAEDLAGGEPVERLGGAGRERGAEQQVAEIAVDRGEAVAERLAVAVGAARVRGRDQRGGGVDGLTVEQRRIQGPVTVEPGAVRGQEVDRDGRRARGGEGGQHAAERLVAGEPAGAGEPSQGQGGHRLGERGEVEEGS